MSINKTYFDFHLSSDGWSKAAISSEENPCDIPANSFASMRMTEFSTDDKPDIWYKAEILNVNVRSELAKKYFEKFGLPKPIINSCIAEREELKNKLQKEFAG